MTRRCSMGLPIAVAAAALLTACGQIHPGAAATVGDSRISFDEVDNLSEGYCRASIAFNESQGQPAEATEGVTSRRTVLGLLLALELARQAAEDLGVEVEPASYVPDEQSYQPLVESVGEEFADEIADIFELDAETTALQVGIGAQQLDQDVSQVKRTKAQQVGQDYVREYAAGVEIDIDPRLALSGDGEVLAATGSLSVPVSLDAVLPQDPAAAGDAVAELPSSQVCS